MEAISLYWFATQPQQQASTVWWQNFDQLYLKFTAEFNKLNLKFWKQQEVPKNSWNWNSPGKRIYASSEAKG